MKSYILQSTALNIFDTSAPQCFDTHKANYATDRYLLNRAIQGIVHENKLEIEPLRYWLIENPHHAGYVMPMPIAKGKSRTDELILAVRLHDPDMSEGQWTTGVLTLSNKDWVTNATIREHFDPSCPNCIAWPPVEQPDHAAYNAWFGEALLEQAHRHQYGAVVASRAIIPVGPFSIDHRFPTPWVAMPDKDAHNLIRERSCSKHWREKPHAA